MIKLFDTPHGHIDLDCYKHLLHDEIVGEFERAFANFVGAKYAVSLSSASNAIFLLLKYFVNEEVIELPSIIPPVVAEYVLHAGKKIRFINNTSWMGNSYVLHKDKYGRKIIDSAQKCKQNQYFNESDNYGDIMFFSHYPTKPIAGIDGGTVVSNDKYVIDKLRSYSFYGMTSETNNWDRKLERIGWKTYMGTIQAEVAFRSLLSWPDRQARIAEIREMYNKAFHNHYNTSDHLYRIVTECHKEVVDEMKEQGIQCGIHYEPLHSHPLFHGKAEEGPNLFQSAMEGTHTLSIPLHAALSDKDVEYIIENVRDLCRL
jgi:dTDP-4-amino-4,6-dideoxygalactose transaminase